MVYKFLFLSFLFVFSSKAQNTFNAQSAVGAKLIIEALPYTNGINKYYFNKTAFNELAIFLKNNKHTYIEVNCYSDFTDTPLMNLMASADQAIDIKNYLISLGIEGSRIETLGNGDMFPIHQEDVLENMSAEDRKKAELENRRIQIVLVKK